MKKASILVIALLILAGNTRVHARPDEEARETLSGISVFVSTLLAASPVNLSYDRLYPVGITHMGYTAGFTMLYLSGAFYSTRTVCGGHLAYTLLMGSGIIGLEMKLGFSYTPFVLEPRDYGRKSEVILTPVLSLGLRTKASKNKGFFRTAISTGGLGIGVGYMF